MFADVVYETGIAFRISRGTNVASVQDEPVVRVTHISLGNAGNEAFFDCNRSCAFGESDFRTDAQQVRIDGHRRFVEDDIEHDVRRLSADTGKLHKLFVCRRHFSVKIVDEDFTERDDVRRLRMVETDRLDISFEFFLSERDDFFGRYQVLRC